MLSNNLLNPIHFPIKTLSEAFIKGILSIKIRKVDKRTSYVSKRIVLKCLSTFPYQQSSAKNTMSMNKLKIFHKNNKKNSS